jgi:hypothetical protein
MKIPLSAAQHIKTMAGDHGLNRAGDAIVIWFGSSVRQHSWEPMLLQRKQSMT